tara:strand:- start:103 stop:405 length:303 start_codon:yes stop_codon:yes gene_type:complete
MTFESLDQIKSRFETSGIQLLIVNNPSSVSFIWIRVEAWIVGRMEQATGKPCQHFTIPLSSGEALIPFRLTTYNDLMKSAPDGATPSIAIAQLFPAAQLH